jgi:hypothetical protein
VLLHHALHVATSTQRAVNIHLAMQQQQQQQQGQGWLLSASLTWWGHLRSKCELTAGGTITSRCLYRCAQQAFTD